MNRTQSGFDRMSAPGSRRQSSSLKIRRSLLSRGPSVQGSRQHGFQSDQQQQQQQSTSVTNPEQQRNHQAATSTILQRRDRLRVYDDTGEDVTPKTLVHPVYSATRRTAFDAIAALASSANIIGGAAQPPVPARASLATVSSFSSVYTLDEILAAKAGRRQSDSIISSARASFRGSVKGLEFPKATDNESDAPSQYHLSKIESQEQIYPDDRITLTLRETETFFLFELAQLTEDATTEIGEATIAENERYEKLRGGMGRKSLDAESQTPQVYVKSRATHVARQERKNRATYVNNWVMHDDLEREKAAEMARIMGEKRRVDDEESRVKFPEKKPEEQHRPRGAPEQQLSAIGEREEYEDATRVALRILASRDYEEAQKRFAGLLRQDPCDPNLELVYGLELLWKHASPKTRRKAVAAFRWNPVNASLLAVGYETRRAAKEDGTPKGFVMIWCAKNPTIPDRCYEFESAVGDLDWSCTRPNLLAVGFYDGMVKVIDVSKKQLSVVWQAEDKAMPSFEPHWQVQWWPMDEIDSNSEQLYTSNQDGRVCCYPPLEEFAAREILRLQRIEGKIAGVPRLNHCLGTNVPLSRHSGALLLRRWPGQPGNYLVGSEEGSVHKCSTAQPHTQIGAAFLAHDGPICSLEFSPFCDRLLLTCGADWTARIWAEGLEEPLLKYTTKMACVNAAAWSPRNSTIFAYAVENEICIWDLRRKSHRPASVTKVASAKATVVKLEFTRSGEQLVAADDEGIVYVYGLKGMPLPALEQTQALVEAVQKALVTKPELLKKLQKLGSPFDKSS